MERTCSSAPARSFLDVHDAEVAFVEPAEVKRAEVDGPDAVADLLEADSLATEQVRHEDLAALPADRGILGDETDLEVRRIRERPRRRRKGPGRGSVPTGRSWPSAWLGRS